MTTSAATLTAIYRYPIKGLTAEPLAAVMLQPDETLPFDRAWAIENGAGRFDPANPKYLPKINFVMLMRNERLATLRSSLDPATRALTITRDGRQVAKGDLGTRIGRQMLEQFLGAYLKSELRGPPRIVESPGHSFSDVAAKCLHIVNLASVRELERVMSRPIDPLRFRANVYLDGLPAWAERQWVGRALAVGAAARLKVFDETERCQATNVDPATGDRDTDIPAVLQRTWGHSDFGVYAQVTAGGDIAVGMPVVV